MSLAKQPCTDAFLSDIRNNNIRYLIDCREREDERPYIITIIVMYHEKHYVIYSRELRTGHFMYVVWSTAEWKGRGSPELTRPRVMGLGLTKKRHHSFAGGGSWYEGSGNRG
jgi:hypothetical protein